MAQQPLSMSAGAPLCAEMTIKRSQFLCYLQRVESEHEARAFIMDVRRTHPTARHHCTAFRISTEMWDVRERSSDDGEPSGTAGSPMLAVLRGAELTNVCAVVVRYFGGILLGTGGLVRAYSDAVTAGIEVLQQAGRLVQQVPMELWSLPVSIAEVGRWEADLRARGRDVVEVSYGQTVSDCAGEGVVRHSDPLRSVIVVALGEDEDPEHFTEEISALSAGSLEPHRTGQILREVPVRDTRNGA